MVLKFLVVVIFSVEARQSLFQNKVELSQAVRVDKDRRDGKRGLYHEFSFNVIVYFVVLVFLFWPLRGHVVASCV